MGGIGLAEVSLMPLASHGTAGCTRPRVAKRYKSMVNAPRKAALFRTATAKPLADGRRVPPRRKNAHSEKRAMSSGMEAARGFCRRDVGGRRIGDRADGDGHRVL